MSNTKVKKYINDVLVLRSGRFIKASKEIQRIYKNSDLQNVIDKKGNHYHYKNGVWRKYTKDGKEIFTITVDKIRGKGRGRWLSRSNLHFSKNGKTFYEMRVFSFDDSRVPFQPNGGGMQILKWSLIK